MIVRSMRTWLTIVVLSAIGGVALIAIRRAVDVHRFAARCRLLEENAVILEWYRRRTAHYPFPGYVGNATPLSWELMGSVAEFQSHDGRRPLLYTASADGAHYVLASLDASGDVEFSASFRDQPLTRPGQKSVCVRDGVLVSPGERAGAAGTPAMWSDNELFRRLRSVAKLP